MVALCAGPARAQSRRSAKLSPKAPTAPSTSRTTSLGKLDTLGIARVAREGDRGEKPDLVLTGLQSDDLGYGQTGVVLAELLGWPHSTIIMQVERRTAAFA